MKVKGHPDFGRLLGAMDVVIAHAGPWKGILYRSAPPKWAAGRNLVSGLGSMKAGARFNAANTFRAIYGSTSPELAMTESMAYQRRAGLPLAHALALVFKAISVQVDRTMDLTDAAVLKTLGVTTEQICSEQWWLARIRGEESLTQAIGRAAHAVGIQAILSHSAHSSTNGRNVIVLPDHLPSMAVKVLRSSPKK